MFTRHHLIALAAMAALAAPGCGERGGEPDAGPAAEARPETTPDAAIEKHPGRHIHVGTHNLFLECWGDGSPVIVIDVGFGDSIDNWTALRERLAGLTRVCIYERAGYGHSEPGPEPRDSGRMATELKTLLEAADEQMPVLLVGHSLGALNIHKLATRHPPMVAGLVLLEPPALGFIAGDAFPDLREMADRMTREFQTAAAAAAGSESFLDRQRAGYFRMLASEHGALFEETARQFVRNHARSIVPLIVVGSGRPNPAFGERAAEFQEFWIRQNRVLAEESVRGRFVLVEDSGHFLHLDAPDRIVEILQQEIDRIRQDPER
jgi:pimeloyl-ACP methyl ester carboxylesterase